MLTQVRPVRETDVERLLAIYSPYIRDTVVSFEYAVPTLSQFRDRVVGIAQKYPYVVCEIENEVVGYAHASQYRVREAYKWSVDVGIYLDGRFHKMGLGKLLYQNLFDNLRAAGFYNAFAGVTLPNAASVALHESFGFRPVGVHKNVGYKFGAWHDVGWWQLVLREPSHDPAPPPSLSI